MGICIENQGVLAKNNRYCKGRGLSWIQGWGRKGGDEEGTRDHGGVYWQWIW